jgi:site-specific DNA-cytosine methylase
MLCKRTVQVLRKHHPELPIHGDLQTLDLTQHADDGKRLDVVVITAPCVDVSARGKGLAQQGQVCSKPRAHAHGAAPGRALPL